MDYHFVSRDTFDRMVAEGAFAEWAEVHGNRYGTAFRTLEDARRKGHNLLLDIDCQGAGQIRRSCGGGVFIFILPPSFQELERRLQGRNTDASEAIQQRIANARQEVQEAIWYDYIIVNDDFEQAAMKLRGIFMAEACRTERALPSVAEQFGIDLKPQDSDARHKKGDCS